MLDNIFLPVRKTASADHGKQKAKYRAIEDAACLLIDILPQ